MWLIRSFFSGGEFVASLCGAAFVDSHFAVFVDSHWERRLWGGLGDDQGFMWRGLLAWIAFAGYTISTLRVFTRKVTSMTLHRRLT